MTSTSFVFTELAYAMKYGEGSNITLFSPSDVTAFHRILPKSDVFTYLKPYMKWRGAVYHTCTK